MKLVMQAAKFAVYDDILEAEAFDRLWRYIQQTNYQSVHSQNWIKTWRLSDGNPMGGPVSFSDETTARSANGLPLDGPLDPSIPPLPVFPTGQSIDELLQVMLANAAGWGAMIGTRGQDWQGFTAKPFLYPSGSGLSWHIDSGAYSGAYVYYAHPEWNVSWGGELLFANDGLAEGVADDKELSIYHPDKRDRIGQHLDNYWESTQLLEVGLGYYVMPKPNRLVVVGGGSAHCVRPVLDAAGDRVRCSVAGFFIRPS